MYRVVTGSFADRANANDRIAELKKAGFDSFIAIE
jgi:N-acetylmuramoyl-L-alanine amidase